MTESIKTFKPVKNNIIVELIAEGASSIILINPEKPQKGRVLAIGSTVYNVEVGDIVSFSAYAGAEIKENDKMYLILDKKDVLAYQ